jgi:hypothetical protein
VLARLQLGVWAGQSVQRLLVLLLHLLALRSGGRCCSDSMFTVERQEPSFVRFGVRQSEPAAHDAEHR